MITWKLTRSEAEYLVDVLEKQGVKQADWLAEDLREVLGMDKKEGKDK